MTTTVTTPESARDRWLDRYEHRTSPWLSFLALVFLVTYSMQMIWPDNKEPWFVAATWFGNFLWLLFAVDLAFRFAVTDDKRHFFQRNWLDTVTVVLPQFRALRALRAFSRNGVFSKRGGFSGGAAITGGLGMAIVVWIGALMVLSAERGHPHAEIVNVPDAVWWTFETITTVGYGDFVPVTGTGRAMAVLVMFVGISIVGVVSASLAAVLIKQSNAPSTPDASAATSPTAATPTATDADLLAEIRELKSMVASLQAAVADRPST